MLGHDAGCLVIDQVAVLDRADPRAHGTDDRLRNVRMGEGIGPAGSRLGDGGADLVLGVLHHVDGIGGRCHPASGHHLDLVGPALELLAGRPANGVDPVGDVREGGAADGAGADVGVVAGGCDVAVPAGLGEDPSGSEHPRPGDETEVERLL